MKVSEHLKRRKEIPQLTLNSRRLRNSTAMVATAVSHHLRYLKCPFPNYLRPPRRRQRLVRAYRSSAAGRGPSCQLWLYRLNNKKAELKDISRFGKWSGCHLNQLCPLLIIGLFILPSYNNNSMLFCYLPCL
jgi:hypothetical protein